MQAPFERRGFLCTPGPCSESASANNEVAVINRFRLWLSFLDTHIATVAALVTSNWFIKHKWACMAILLNKIGGWGLKPIPIFVPVAGKSVAPTRLLTDDIID